MEKKENGESFIDLLINFTKLLNENYSMLNSYIDITNLIKFDTNEENYTYTHTNTILSYYKEQGLIKDKSTRGDLKFVFREFLIDKSNFEELKRKLSLD